MDFLTIREPETVGIRDWYFYRTTKTKSRFSGPIKILTMHVPH